ncbi:MAG: DMT family transporter [Rhizobiaceae bacterium]
MSTDPIPLPQSASVQTIDRRGIMLVAGSALAWSFGGAIDRFIDAPDTWTVVFWRSVWAASFLSVFLLARDGKYALNAFKSMGWPGLVVALCFMTASISFVQAIAYTTVANVILINAAVPLVAALIARIFLNEMISGATWAAIAAVIAGVAIMVSDGSGETGSIIGILLALLITFVFAIATVVTRRHANVRMTPAVITATTLAAIVAATQAGAFAVSSQDMGWLFAFGALNLGLGMALFVTGARLIPSAMAALLGTLETVLGPVWVWLAHGEKASAMTIVGGGIVLAALISHLAISNRSRPAG